MTSSPEAAPRRSPPTTGPRPRTSSAAPCGRPIAPDSPAPILGGYYWQLQHDCCSKWTGPTRPETFSLPHASACGGLHCLCLRTLHSARCALERRQGQGGPSQEKASEPGPEGPVLRRTLRAPQLLLRKLARAGFPEAPSLGFLMPRSSSPIEGDRFGCSMVAAEWKCFVGG